MDNLTKQRSEPTVIDTITIPTASTSIPQDDHLSHSCMTSYPLIRYPNWPGIPSIAGFNSNYFCARGHTPTFWGDHPTLIEHKQGLFVEQLVHLTVTSQNVFVLG